jgi:AraC family transcriptional regulator
MDPKSAPRLSRSRGDEPHQLRFERDALGLRLLRTVGVDLPTNLVVALYEDNVHAVPRPGYGDYLTLTFLLGGAAFCRRKCRNRGPEYSKAGAASIQPHDVASVWDSSGRSRWLHFFLPPSMAGAMAQAAFDFDPSEVTINPETGIGDFELLGVLYASARAMFSAEFVSVEDLDNWSSSIVAHLLVNHSNVSRRIAGTRRETLAAHQLRQALEYIEANLCGQITIEALARTARMSPYHFAHGFRARTGLPPYKYVQRRRVERSRHLLGDLALSICEVADQMGYSSQAHFATAFRRELGITPREYRRLTTGELDAGNHLYEPSLPVAARGAASGVTSDARSLPCN